MRSESARYGCHPAPLGWRTINYRELEPVNSRFGFLQRCLLTVSKSSSAAALGSFMLMFKVNATSCEEANLASASPSRSPHSSSSRNHAITVDHMVDMNDVSRATHGYFVNQNMSPCGNDEKQRREIWLKYGRTLQDPPWLFVDFRCVRNAQMTCRFARMAFIS